jgi:hypothetical protein
MLSGNVIVSSSGNARIRSRQKRDKKNFVAMFSEIARSRACAADASRRSRATIFFEAHDGVIGTVAVR